MESLIKIGFTKESLKKGECVAEVMDFNFINSEEKLIKEYCSRIATILYEVLLRKVEDNKK